MKRSELTSDYVERLLDDLKPLAARLGAMRGASATLPEGSFLFTARALNSFSEGLISLGCLARELKRKETVE